MARLANYSCVLPRETKRCAKKIVNKFSEEQKKKYGINNDSMEEAIVAIAQIVQVHVGAKNDLDVRNRMLNDIDSFVSYLENKVFQREFEEPDLEDAVEEYNKTLEAFKKYGKGRLGKFDLNGLDSDEIFEIKKLVYSHPLVLATKRYEDPDDREKVTSINYIIKEPVINKKPSLQQQTLNKLKAIKKIKSRWEGVEKVDGKETGRSKWYYNGKVITTTSVTSDVDPVDPDKPMPIASLSLGTFIDRALRDIFDEDSLLNHNKNDDAFLSNYLEESLGGIFTVDGLKRFINDCEILKQQMRDAWGDDIIFFSDSIKLFGKTTDAEGNEMWMTGSPDLLVIDRSGLIHVIDFKSVKMRKPKDYSKGLVDDTFRRGEKYGKQESRYIKMLESHLLDVDNDPYIVQVDTWYDSTDEAVPVKLERNKSQTGKKEIYIRRKDENNREHLEIVDPESGDIITLGEYAERAGDPQREDAYDEEMPLYIQPRLHVSNYSDEEGFTGEIDALRKKDKGEIVPDEDISFDMQTEVMTEEEKSLMTWFIKGVIHKKAPGTITRLSEDDITSRPDILGSEDIRKIAEYIMYAVSNAIEKISKEGRVYHVGQIKVGDKIIAENQTIGGDGFIGKSHKEIISEIGIENIINEVFDEYITQGYDPDFPSEEEYMNNRDDKGYYEDEDEIYIFENEEEYKKQKLQNDRREWLIRPKHRKQLIVQGYNKLMALESDVAPYTVKDNNNLKESSHTTLVNTDNQDANYDTGDENSNTSFADRYNEGLADLEAWMIGVRNYSPKASLAKEIKRLFESIVVKNEDNRDKDVLDPYGFGFKEHLDSTMAMQTLLEACRVCETWEEMEKTLRRLSKRRGNHWVKQILDTITAKGNENLKTKFFRHFRKDALIYSVSDIHYDKKTGKRIVTTRVINRKSAFETMSQSLGASFNNGSVGRYWHPDYKNTLTLISREDGRNQLTSFTPGKVSRSTVSQLILNDIKKWKEEIGNIYKRMSAELTPEECEDYLREAFMNNKVRNGQNVIEGITNILNGVGIMVPQEVVFNTCMANLGKLNSGGYGNSNAFKLLFGVDAILRNLNKTQNEEGSIPNSLRGHGAYKFYAPIIEKLSNSVQEFVEASVYEDGKTYYSYTNPSRLGHIVRCLTDAIGSLDEVKTDEEGKEIPGKFKNYLKNEYVRYSGWYKDNRDQWLVDWLDQLEKDPEAREAFEHKVELSFIGTQYRDLGSLGFLRSILHNYLGTMDDKAGWRWFALPTMSNKPTNEFLRMKKYRNPGEIIEKVLMPTFTQESNRIADVLFSFANNRTAVDKMDITRKKLEKLFNPKGDKSKEEETNKLIEGLKRRINEHRITRKDLITLSKLESGAKFHFLYYMNKEIATNEDLGNKIAERINLLLMPNDLKGKEERLSLVDQSDTNKLVEATIKSNMEVIVKEEMDRIEKIGLFEKETRKDGSVVMKYQEEFYVDKDKNFGEGEKQFREAIEDFIWQDVAANINIIQITGGDLAYYGNATEYQKRIAQIHSPGLHIMHNPEYDDGYLRSVHVSDMDKVTSEIIENAKVTLERAKNALPKEQQHDFQMIINKILKGFEDFNVTDGQSFTALTAMRKKLRLMGEWDDKKEEAWKRVRSGNFDINDLGILSQPTKPFVTSDMAKYSGSPTMTLRRVPLQDKNSEYLLLIAEALSTGAGMKSKMKAIYDFMEESLKINGDKKGIDTVHFHSVGKVGASGIIDLNKFDKEYDGPEESYSQELTKYMLKHIRVADGSGETVQDKDIYQEQIKLMTEGILKPEEIIYNSAYVDTIPVEDYIIQQEVPAHLLDGRDQLYGSQIRILGITDITPGTKFDVNGKEMSDEELVKEYKDLHAKNIKESFINLLKEMGLDEIVEINQSTGEVVTVTPLAKASIEKRNKIYSNLETLLQKELSKDAKYGFDAKRACTLRRDANGDVIDFEVPLMDPIQSRRIQMLLNSIIKKSINKQRINGGPVVQTTAYDNNLHIRFKHKNGGLLFTREEYEGWEVATHQTYEEYVKENQAGIAYFECYMPIPNATIERLVTNPDGSTMSYEELKQKLPEEVFDSMMQAIGYRIPTEDKYSMIPLKIMGFVPKAAGEVIMMPKEITYLTGSDFDIDKMYIMMKEFDIADGVSKNNKDLEKYITDLDCEAILRKYHAETGNHWNNQGWEQVVKDVVRLGYNILHGSERTWRREPITLTDNTKWSEVQKFIKWYQGELVSQAFKEVTDQQSENPRIAKKARNNRLIDLQWAVLTSEDTATKMLNPQSFDTQKKVGRVIRIIKNGIKPHTEYENLIKMEISELDAMLENSDAHSTTLPFSKIYFQRQNMQGSQMVGIFANNNVSHAFMTFQRVGIQLKRGGYNNSFNFDGVTIGGEDPTLLDPQRGFDGQLISKTIASFLAASVDTAKDPTLDDMNISTFTGGVAMVLARMGYSAETIGLFLSQPIIRELSDLFFKNKTEGYYDGDKAIRELMSQLDINKEQLDDKSNIRDGSLTKENFLKHLRDDNLKGNDFQLKVLSGFHSLFQISKSLQELTFCTKYNSVNNAAGPTIADTIEDQNRVNKFKADVQSESPKNVFYIPGEGSDEKFTAAQDVISNDPILKAFYNSTVGSNGASEILFKSFFPHYYGGFQNLLSYFKENYTRNGKISSKLYNQLLNAYIYYLLTYRNEEAGFKPVFPSGEEGSSDDVEYLVKDILSRYKDVQKIKGRRKNPLLDSELGANCLRVREADEYINTDILVFNASGLSSEAQENIRIAWSDLITMDDPNLSEVDNNKIRRFGVDLFFYTMMRNGFGFSPRTLMHLASVIVRKNALFENGDFNSYLDGLDNLEKIDDFLMGAELDDQKNMERFLDQFIKNNTNNKQLIPNFSSNDPNIATIGRDANSLIVSAEKGKEYKIRALKNDGTPLKYITLTTKGSDNKLHTSLYKLSEDDDDISDDDKTVSYRYIKTNMLGLVNNFIEYNANADLNTSMFEEIRGSSADSFEEDNSQNEDSQFAGDNVVEGSETDPDIDPWNAISRAIRKLSGRQQTDSDYRKILKDAFKESSKNNTPLAGKFLSLLAEKDEEKKQGIMDEINKEVEDQNACKK